MVGSSALGLGGRYSSSTSLTLALSEYSLEPQQRIERGCLARSALLNGFSKSLKGFALLRGFLSWR